MMMMTIKKTFLFFMFFSFTAFSFAQEEDFGLWFGASASHKLLRKLDVELSGSLRTFNKTSQIEESFLEGGLQYSFNKYISVSGSYRLTSKIEDNSDYYYRHKLFLGIKTSVPVRNFSFSGRLMIQRTSKTYIKDEEDLTSNYYGRLKLKVAYSIPAIPLKPYIYCEPFIPVFSGSEFKISKNRLSAGAELNVTRWCSFETEYIFQRDYQPRISDIHIISINFKTKF